MTKKGPLLKFTLLNILYKHFINIDKLLLVHFYWKIWAYYHWGIYHLIFFSQWKKKRYVETRLCCNLLDFWYCIKQYLSFKLKTMPMCFTNFCINEFTQNSKLIYDDKSSYLLFRVRKHSKKADTRSIKILYWKRNYD